MHRKHAAIARPPYGEFSRQEYAFIGTPCGNIQRLTAALGRALWDDFEVGYVDADHGQGSSSALPAHRTYTDKITHHRLDFSGDWNKHQYRAWFNDQDVVLVNGNHFRAARQVVVIDPKKKDSLQRKLDRLTDVRLFLLAEGEEEIWPYLREHLPNWAEIPTLSLQDTEGITAWLRRQLRIPPLKGLVLAGGKSIRMGTDKGALDFHGKPQREHMADLLIPLCEEVYLSVRAGQEVPSDHALLEDTFTGLGPYGALLSAFRFDPDSAWLLVACDLPLLDSATLQQLKQARNPRKIATAFQSPLNEFPEPLITIWEPKAYQYALHFLAQGYSCPRKVLINSDMELLHAKHPKMLMNVNTPEELERVKKEIDHPSDNL